MHHFMKVSYSTQYLFFVILEGLIFFNNKIGDELETKNDKKSNISHLKPNIKNLLKNKLSKQL